jgi:hypothetical protein
MPRVQFEPTNPTFERVKTVHALDRSTTVIGSLVYVNLNAGVRKVLSLSLGYMSLLYAFEALVRNHLDYSVSLKKHIHYMRSFQIVTSI